MLFISRERDSLKDIMSSYQSEVTLNPTVLGEVRIIKLEELLNQSKKECQKLESELDELQGLNKIDGIQKSNKADIEKIKKT